MVKNTSRSTASLGEEFKATRRLRKLSLAAAAKPAKISAAYLQKLESGRVQNPSPRVLLRLAETLDTEYERLMELAGYVSAGGSVQAERASFLEAALRHEDLTDEEQRAVVAFILYLKGLR